MKDAIGVLDAPGWCIEQVGEGGIRTVLPLAGWLVTADGELRPLPLSLGNEWTVRPRTASDEGAIEATVMRMRPHTQNWSYVR